jgi:UDPglucose 6-dehydrogenase
MHESLEFHICRDLLEKGAILQFVDLKLSDRQMALALGKGPADSSWQRVADVHQAAAGADALLLLTEWQQFARIAWDAVAGVMRHPAWLFDARAKADGEAARPARLRVWTVGEG